MQEARNLQVRYTIRKLLDAIPGTADFVSQKLANLLQNPDALLNPAEDRNLQQVHFLLQHPETNALTTATIEERIGLLKGSTFLRDVLQIVVSYSQVNELLPVMLVSKTWHKTALQRWRDLLANDFGVNPEIANKLPRPNLVYYKICILLKEHQIADRRSLSDHLSFGYFVQKYGLDSFCFCSDVEDSQEFEKFFSNNVIPDLVDVAFLGNLSLVQYLDTQLHRNIRHPSTWSIVGLLPESVSTVQYLVDRGVPISYKPDSFVVRDSNSYCDRLPHMWRHALNANDVLKHWNLFITLLSYEQLALTGSVELVMKKRLTEPKDDPKYEIIYPIYMLECAIRSRSLGLVRFLFESPISPIAKKIAQLDIHDADHLLAVASAWSTMLIVKYLIETRRIQPSTNTMQAAVISGSLALVKYLREYLKKVSPGSDTLRFSYRPEAIQSSSLRMFKYAVQESSEQLPFKKSDLNNAARAGLLPILCFILNSVNPPVADQETLNDSLQSNFPFTFQYLSKFNLIPQHDDLLTYVRNSLFLCRQVVEKLTFVFKDVTFSAPDRNYCVRYLNGITPQNNSPTFWNKVLSAPCETIVLRLRNAILFDIRGNPRQWFPKSVLKVSINGTYYALIEQGLLKQFGVANILVNVPILRDDSNKIIVITSMMCEILIIIDNLLCQQPQEQSLLKSEQGFLQALQKIKAKLDQGISENSDPPAAVEFYKSWQTLVNKVIFDCSDLEPMPEAPNTLNKS